MAGGDVRSAFQMVRTIAPKARAANFSVKLRGSTAWSKDEELTARELAIVDIFCGKSVDTAEEVTTETPEQSDGYDVSSVSANVAKEFSVTLDLGTAQAEEVVALASFTSNIHVVFAQMFSIDVSMITVSSVEATSASTILTAFSAAGRGLSMSTITGGLNSND